MNIFTKSNLRKDIFMKSLAVKSCSNLNRTTKYDCPKATDMYPNRPRTSSSMAIGPQTSQARSIRGDQACTQLGRNVATERPSRSVDTDRARAKARSLRSDRALPKRRYDTSPCILVYPLMLSPEDRSELSSCFPPFEIINQSLRDLRHDSRPILRFLNQKPVNCRTVYDWFAREDKWQKSKSINRPWSEYIKSPRREAWGEDFLDSEFSALRNFRLYSRQLYQLNYVRLDPRKGANFGSHSLALEVFGARRRGGYGLLLLMATKRLIETMSGYIKDKLAALTAPMVNAYANAVLFNKIENLVATFRHKKSTKTSSRFLPVNTKENDKSYQNL
ncbi:hypothetical protein IGI04_030087 [Brassica rapa subsp. trilocularis]|uniref:Uncharacterized protein n=1 Tax=Brassica rapa subsp. trilocularis TaxID=1813537 RepID=A0ABQ7LPP6_BRACM|nr:hypothetical protein IGI04_030087 [Brassica rapa subsp. trilocularis]